MSATRGGEKISKMLKYADAVAVARIATKLPSRLLNMQARLARSRVWEDEEKDREERSNHRDCRKASC